MIYFNQTGVSLVFKKCIALNKSKIFGIKFVLTL